MVELIAYPCISYGLCAESAVKHVHATQLACDIEDVESAPLADRGKSFKQILS